MTSPFELLRSRVIDSGLNVKSGVYCAVDGDLAMRLDPQGEYEYVGLDADYDGPAEQLLAVSAFGGVGPTEGTIARELYASQAGAKSHPVAGHYVGAYAGWALDPLRAAGSSGGLTTWLLTTLLESGEVDGVIHMAPTGRSERLFEYTISRSVEEVRSRSKSRYFPGELSRVLRQVADRDGRYALVAIPSIVYEVRLLQRVSQMYRDRISVVIGLICGHQKTANYAEFLGWSAGFDPGSLTAIDFRKKLAHLSANSYSTELTGVVNGEEQVIVRQQDELFGTDWGHGFFKSKFSDFTEDALNETADVVVGDAWLPDYVKDSRGTNIVITRAAWIDRILRRAQQKGDVHLDPLSVERVISSQRALVRQNVKELPYRVRRLESAAVMARPLRRPHGQLLTPGRRRIQKVRLQISRSSHSMYLAARAAGDLESFVAPMQALVSRYSAAQILARRESRIVDVARRAVRSLLAIAEAPRRKQRSQD